jgi:hypothetical protein
MLMKDLDSAYSSKICEFCDRYKRGTFPVELFYCRGRKKRWVTTCHDCASDSEFRENGLALVTVDEQGQVYDSIKQTIKDAGRPITLVDAIKIAASRDAKVRNYFGVDDALSEEEDKCLWSLIYEIVSEGPNSRRIQALSVEPILIVSCSQE